MNQTMEITECDDAKLYPLLHNIDSPADLRKLPVEKLPALCAEIRRCIIDNLASNPGHFASSMGAVEITVALHYVFDTPSDHIVWDVGHQAYAHKILTGRRRAFSRLRKSDGPSGFPSPMESEYDTFTTGHAGNSISAALGMAVADSLTPGCEDRKTVAVIGDASISSGLAFEGLNNASNDNTDLLIVLNDNDMSIDDNVGALHRYLSKITTSSRYNRWRYLTSEFLKRHGMFDENKRGLVLRFNNSVKALVAGSQNIFEGLNIRYFGPMDGHDVIKLVSTFRELKDMRGPRILHLNTIKGKGYESAEKDPTTWHAPGKFNPTTGERICSPKTAAEPLKWQEVFGKTLVELADSDNRVVGITAAMLSGTSMSEMAAAYPDRTFDTGISEGHAVTFAGGLASRGLRPFCAIYSSFLQRGYDNIVNDISIQGLPVTLCIDRAGIVGEDGVTHHGMFDIGYLSVVPGMRVASPMDEATLRNLMYSSLRQNAPLAIRYPRGKAVSSEWRTPFAEIEEGRGRLLREAPEGTPAVLSFGPSGNDVSAVLNTLAAEGIQAAHYDMIWAKPLDTAILREAAARHSVIITVEDGAVRGGFGQSVSVWIKENGLANPTIMLGAPDKWIHHGTVAELKAECGYDRDSIAEAVRQAAKTSVSK